MKSYVALTVPATLSIRPIVFHQVATLVHEANCAVDVAEVVTALVTNAIRYTTGPVTVRVAWEADTIEVEVADRRRRYPRAEPLPHPTGEPDPLTLATHIVEPITADHRSSGQVVTARFPYRRRADDPSYRPRATAIRAAVAAGFLRDGSFADTTEHVVVPPSPNTLPPATTGGSE